MIQEAVIITFQILILLISVVIHEVSHGLMAYRLGDPTAKYAGRLTLNPLKHLDLWGSFIVPLLMFKFLGLAFGWAKPVPYNPFNLRDQRHGPALVGLAGPLSNIALALIFGLGARFIMLPLALKQEIANNLANYSELPFIISQSFGSIFFLLFVMIGIINLFLAFFNLLPIPPLDGSKLLFSVFNIKTETAIMLEQFGFLFLMALIFLFSPLLGIFFSGIFNFFFGVVVGI